MTLPDTLQHALRRLDSALAQLDAAAGRRTDPDATRSDAEAEFAAFEEDRSRLAAELDAALARIEVLDRAAADVSARLDHASSTVRGMLAGLTTDDPGPRS